MEHSIVPSIGQAVLYAMEAHKDQTRKYTGEPYLVHCAEVAAIVYRYCGTTAMVCAAWLHDVVEDCNVPLAAIQRNFGGEVYDLVAQLSDVTTPADGNRKLRKTIERSRWVGASAAAKTVKLADLISNTRSIVRDDPNFAKVYLEEKRLLMPHLVGGNPLLWEIANRQANEVTA